VVIPALICLVGASGCCRIGLRGFSIGFIGFGLVPDSRTRSIAVARFEWSPDDRHVLVEKQTERKDDYTEWLIFQKMVESRSELLGIAGTVPKHVVKTDRRSEVLVLDPTGQKEPRTLGSGHGFRLSPRGTYAAYADEGESGVCLCLVNYATGDRWFLSERRPHVEVSYFTFSHDGKWLAWTGRHRDIFVASVDDPSVVRSFQIQVPEYFEASIEGRLSFKWSTDGGLYFKETAGHWNIAKAAPGPDCRSWYSRYAPPDWRMTKVGDAPFGPGLAFQATPRGVYAAYADKEESGVCLCLVNYSTGQKWLLDERKEERLFWGMGRYLDVRFSQDGRWLAWVSGDLSWKGNLPGGGLPSATYVASVEDPSVVRRLQTGILGPMHQGRWLEWSTDGAFYFKKCEDRRPSEPARFWYWRCAPLSWATGEPKRNCRPAGRTGGW